MPRSQVSHYQCDHDTTSYARLLCRMRTRHEGCDHPMTAWLGKVCDEYRTHHAECQHGMTIGEIRECQRAQEKE